MPPRLCSPRVLSFTSICTSRPHSAANITRCLSTCLNGRRPYSGKAASFRRPGSSRAFHATSIPSAPKDPYQVLGVKKGAAPSEIKKTYFALARKYHPDTNPDKSAQGKFVEIQEAYDILKDEKKRAEYDKYGPASQQPGFDANAYENARSAFGQGSSPFGQGSPFGFSSSMFGGNRRRGSDLFETMFEVFSDGAGGGQQQFQSGANLETTIGVSFMEACKGTSRTVNITPVVQCTSCSGSGLKAGARRSTCPTCDGSGVETHLIQGFQMQSNCRTCGGAGSVTPPQSQCDSCHGQGYVRTRTSVKVDIPAGVEDGVALRMSGRGDAPIGGSGRAGDLFIRINVAPSKLFKRQGANLFYEAPIPVHAALLGGKVRVPTLDGEFDVRVPAGTQPGEQMVLKGHGITATHRPGKGDLFVTFNLQVPRSLTSRQRELLQQYANDVEGKTANVSRQDTRQESSTTTTTDEPSPGNRASPEAETETKTRVNEPFTEPPESEASVDKHAKRDQDRKKRATA